MWGHGPSSSLPFLSPFSAPPRLTLPFLGCKKRLPIYSITERRVPELIPVLGSQPADDVKRCHYFPPGLPLPSQLLRGLLPILLLGEQRHDGCEQLRLLLDSVAAAI